MAGSGIAHSPVGRNAGASSPDAILIDTDEFRRVMGHLATGVTVVAALGPEDDVLFGLTANAVASLSLDPVLALVCVERSARSHDGVLQAGHFSINVLSADQERLSRRFATAARDEKFQGIAFRTESSGAPILEDALAWLECRVWADYPGGDHTIIVGEVIGAGTGEGEPLIYYRGGYGSFAP